MSLKHLLLASLKVEEVTSGEKLKQSSTEVKPAGQTDPNLMICKLLGN